LSWKALRKDRALDWTERILGFPVRTAAVDDFLRDLKAKGSGDLNAVMTTLNEGGLCRETLDYWMARGWISVSPSTPLHALAGPNFSREIALREFCGEEVGRPSGESAETEVEESISDEDQ
jgi:glycerol-3-phosphate dehydrogenase